MTPYDIPKVVLLDGKGHERDEGYFFRYPEHTGPGIYNGAPPKIPDVIGYATYDCGDWSLPNTPKFLKVTPPHRFVVKPTADMVRMGAFLKECSALFRTGDPVRADRLMQVAEFVGSTGGPMGEVL